MRDESTTEISRWLQDLHNHFNEWVFSGLLPKCIVGISDKDGLNCGYYRARKKTQQSTGDVVYEIWLKPEYLDSSVYEVYLDLLQQQLRVIVHSRLNQPDKGYSYYDRQFADAALTRGLDCVGVGENAGARTGFQIELKFIKGGIAMKALEAMPAHLMVVPFKSRSEEIVETKPKRKTRLEIECSDCGWKSQVTKRDSQAKYCPICAAQYLKETDLKPTLSVKK